MRWHSLAHDVETSGSLLPLAGVTAAEAYLSCRLGLLKAEQAHERWQRPRRLLDRAAAFWLVHEWLETHGLKKGVVLFGRKARGSSGPVRILWLGKDHCPGDPWEAPPALLERVGFASDALAAFGALVVPQPLTEEHLQQPYGACVVEARRQYLNQERAAALAQLLPPPAALLSGERRRF